MPPKRALKNDSIGPWETVGSWTRIVVVLPRAGPASPSVELGVAEGSLLGAVPLDPGSLDDDCEVLADAVGVAVDVASGVVVGSGETGSGVACERGVGVTVGFVVGFAVGFGVVTGFEVGAEVGFVVGFGVGTATPHGMENKTAYSFRPSADLYAPTPRRAQVPRMLARWLVEPMNAISMRAVAAPSSYVLRPMFSPA